MIYVRRTESEVGNYVGADGVMWYVEWCHEVYGATPEQLGYSGFESIADALEVWGLIEYIDPEEEILTEHNENE